MTMQLIGALLIMLVGFSIAERRLFISQEVCTAGRIVAIQCIRAADAALPIIVKRPSPIIFRIKNKTELKKISAKKEDVKAISSRNGSDLLVPWKGQNSRYRLEHHSEFHVTFQILDAQVEDSGYYGCNTTSDRGENIELEPVLVYDAKPAVNIDLYMQSEELKQQPNGEVKVNYDSFSSSSIDLALAGTMQHGDLILRSKMVPSSVAANITESRVISPKATAKCDSTNSLCSYTVNVIVHVQFKQVSDLHWRKVQLQLVQPNNNYVAWDRTLRFIDSSQRTPVVEKSQLKCKPSRQTVQHDGAVIIGCSVPDEWINLDGFTANWQIVSDTQFYPINSVNCSYPQLTINNNADASLNDKMIDVAENSCRNNKFFSSLEADFQVKQMAGRTGFYMSIPYAKYVQNGRTMNLTINADPEFFTDGPFSAAFSVKVETPPQPSSAGAFTCSKPLLGLMMLLLLILQLPIDHHQQE